MSEEKRYEVETTGHVWDEDLQEYSNPLPRWWLWAFYATIIFSFTYWIYYPTWPLPGGTHTTGLATVEVNGEIRNWNTRNLLENRLAHSNYAVLRNENLTRLESMDFAAIEQSPEMSAFVRAMGRVLFSDNCAVCHGQGGEGALGNYPALVDDAWIWGGSAEQIHTTITKGRNAIMTAFSGVLSDQEITDVAKYVLHLGGASIEPAVIESGRAIFEGKGTCFTCHGKDGMGNPLLGAPNLTDKIWETFVMDSNTAESEKLALIEHRVRNGVQFGQRQMPAWTGRLSNAEIKILTAYVRQLAGGN